jgi:hypothetical protein
MNATNNHRAGIGFEIYFQRLAQEVAIMIPSSPSTIIGFRPAAQLAIEQWWSQAKRNAFRTWSHLINSQTGIFLVTKAVKTKRVAQCLSSGQRGQQTHIHVHGLLNIPRSNHEVELTSNGTTWTCTRNDMEFTILEAEERKEYTVFIERASSRMFLLTEALKAAAQNLWTYEPLPPLPFQVLIAGRVWQREHLNKLQGVPGWRLRIQDGLPRRLHRHLHRHHPVPQIPSPRQPCTMAEIVLRCKTIGSSSKAATTFSSNTPPQPSTSPPET